MFALSKENSSQVGILIAKMRNCTAEVLAVWSGFSMPEDLLAVSFCLVQLNHGDVHSILIIHVHLYCTPFHSVG